MTPQEPPIVQQPGQAMQISGWDRTRTINAQVLRPRGTRALCEAVRAHAPLIARGMGRSYGDSSLAASVLDLRSLDKLLAFDPDTGLLHCHAGVTLDRIIEVFLPQRWFPAVVPGTSQVSVGGAIASDVHGKNHHHAGSFANSVESFSLCLADGSLKHCSRQQNAELFHAACGGMGLLGVITEVRLQLMRVPGTSIRQQVIATRGLEETIEVLDQNESAPYSVAWLDLVNHAPEPGLVLLGKHCPGDGSAPSGTSTVQVPVPAPVNLVRKPLMQLHARLHHWRQSRTSEAVVNLREFFFPLDGIGNWNYLYGPQGLTQFQCLIPCDGAPGHLSSLLQIVRNSAETVSLAVLKRLGNEGPGPLSFARSGYTLALDFPGSATLVSLLEQLQQKVMDLGGRVYLSKDNCMSTESFRSGYPRWQEFRKLRRDTGADQTFRSLQSDRLGL